MNCKQISKSVILGLIMLSMLMPPLATATVEFPMRPLNSLTENIVKPYVSVVLVGSSPEIMEAFDLLKPFVFLASVKYVYSIAELSQLSDLSTETTLVIAHGSPEGLLLQDGNIVS